MMVKNLQLNGRQRLCLVVSGLLLLGVGAWFEPSFPTAGRIHAQAEADAMRIYLEYSAGARADKESTLKHCADLARRNPADPVLQDEVRCLTVNGRTSENLLSNAEWMGRVRREAAQERIAERLPSEQAAFIGKVLAVWLASICALYAMGYVFVWVRRGFEKPPLP